MSSYLTSLPTRAIGSLGIVKKMTGIVYDRARQVLPDEWNCLADTFVLACQTIGIAGSTDPNSHEYRLDQAEAQMQEIYDAVYSEGVIYPTPDAASKQATTAGSDWGWGSYVEIWNNAETADKRHVYQVYIEEIELQGTNDGLYELEIASGEAASEVAIGRTMFRAQSDADIMPLPIPIQCDELPANTRLSFRVRYDDGSTATSDVDIRVLYHDVT